MTPHVSDEPAIQVLGLEKAYKQLQVLAGVDFEVAKGSIFALLGANGAGKTTIIKILSTLLTADAGTARVNGLDVATQPAKVRACFSLTGQFAAVDELLSGQENLVLVARLRRLQHPRTIADGLLERFSLTDAATRKVATYSGGMRRRLDLAMSLIGDPPVIFLDEPTTGLDPQARLEVWQAVKDLAEHGTTVLLTTQYLEEADQLADRIAVIDHGKVIAEGTPGQLKASVGAGALHLRLPDPAERAHAEQVLTQALGVPVHPASDPTAISVKVADSGRVARALAELSRAGVALTDFSVGQRSLDEVFLALTGRPSRHDATTKEDAA